MTRMPTFLVIGAAKAGTTSIYSYLQQHPHVFMSPVKEPDFFIMEGESEPFRDCNGPILDDQIIKTLEEYQRLFDGRTSELASGECSTGYLAMPGCAARIHRHIPDVKLIAILRNPLDRAYSQFQHRVQLGQEPLLNFADALRAEDARVRDHWHYKYYYKSRGFYGRQLRAYFDHFSPDQIQVLLYEDLNRDNDGVVRKMFSFLGVEPNIPLNVSKKLHVNGSVQRPRIEFLEHLLHGKSLVDARKLAGHLLPKQLRTVLKSGIDRWNQVPLSFEPEVRSELAELYREDIQDLQKLIGRDLAHWLEPQPAGRASEPSGVQPATATAH